MRSSPCHRRAPTTTDRRSRPRCSMIRDLSPPRRFGPCPRHPRGLDPSVAYPCCSSRSAPWFRYPTPRYCSPTRRSAWPRAVPAAPCPPAVPCSRDPARFAARPARCGSLRTVVSPRPVPRRRSVRCTSRSPRACALSHRAPVSVPRPSAPTHPVPGARRPRAPPGPAPYLPRDTEPIGEGEGDAASARVAGGLAGSVDGGGATRAGTRPRRGRTAPRRRTPEQRRHPADGRGPEAGVGGAGAAGMRSCGQRRAATSRCRRASPAGPAGRAAQRRPR